MRFRSVLKQTFIAAAGVYCMDQDIALAAGQEPVRNVVLVHGAWADGSSWAKVIPLLEKRGLHVVAVQNPLSSLADDVAATKRAINAQDGPVVLVGHSYGGAVITEAGNNPKVAGWFTSRRSVRIRVNRWERPRRISHLRRWALK